MGISIQDKLALLEKSEADWVNTLAEMVSVDSGPGDTDGADRMVGILKDLWKELGWDVEVQHAGAPVVLARRPGVGPRILLVGHYDTVFPSGTAAERPFEVTEGRAQGPGSADMKAGLVVQAAAMSVLDDDRCDLMVMTNGDEESGSIGSRPLIEALAPEADVVLVFEPGEPDGAIVTGRPGVRRFRIGTVGRSAHTGVEPELGRNAIEGVAHVVLAVAEVNRRGDFGTVTVATIEGGSRPNIVPAEATILIDGRVPTQEAGDRLAQELARVASSIPVSDVSGWLEPLEDRPAFVPTEESTRYAALFCRLAQEAGVEVSARPARGSSDGNFTAGMGIPTLDGLGPPGGSFHTDGEWVSVGGICIRAAIVAGFIEMIGKD